MSYDNSSDVVTNQRGVAKRALEREEEHLISHTTQ